MESGFTTGRHGKRKVNQETQSPLLKIFKDVMLKEASDQEKMSLLSDMPDDKRNQYSTQCNTTLMAIPSRPSVHAQKKDSKKMKGKQSEKKLEKPFSKHYDAFCTSSKQEKNKESEKYCCDPRCSADDTFSCNSCALKKMLCNNYTLPCAGKLPGFAIALVLLVVLLYFASGGCNGSKYYGLESWFKSADAIEDSKTLERQDSRKALSERAKEQQGTRNVEVGLVDRLKDVVGYKEGMDPRSYSDDMVPNDVHVINDNYGAAPGSVGGMSYLNNLENNFRSGENKELDNILRNNRDFRNSEHLQNFYRKLLETDAQIKKLKRSHSNNYNRNMDENYSNNQLVARKKSYYYPRYKRSLWRFKRPFGSSHKTRTEKEPAKTAEGVNGTGMATVLPTLLAKAMDKGMDSNGNVTAVRNLRQITFNVHAEDPSKILIQKKGIVYKFHPSANDRRSKCTHVVTDSKSHEKKLKHPFYKNSQRLDELLDQLLDKNLNKILEPLQGDPFFKHTHAKQGKEFDKDQNKEVVSAKTSRLVTSSGLLGFSRLFKNPFRKENKNNKGTNLPLSFDEFMKAGDKFKEEETSTSTVATRALIDERERDSIQIGTPDTHKNPIHHAALIIMPRKHPPSQVPHMRRLLQADDEYDSSIHYTDGKEVLSDGHEPHDDGDKGEDAFVKRSMDQETNPDDSSRQVVYTNPNWKGPMPLYLEEIRDLESAPPASMGHKGGMKRRLRKAENFEEYGSRDEHNFKLAQAYSDYGVLEDKKNSQSTPSTEVTDGSKHSFKRQSGELSLPNDEDWETNSKEETASKDWQKAKANFLATWSGRLGKVLKIVPDKMAEEGTELRFGSGIELEPSVATERAKSTESKKNKSYKSRSLLAVVGFTRPDDSDDDDDDDDEDEEESPVKIASFKIIRKREVDAPKFELVDKTKNFNDSDHLLDVLSQWFGNMASMSNGTNCLGRKSPAELAPSPSPSPAQTESPSTKSNEYSQVTHITRDENYWSPPFQHDYMSYKFRSLLSLNEDKVGNNTDSASDEEVKANLTLMEDTKDEVKAVTVSASDVFTFASTTAKTILNASRTTDKDKGDNKTVVKRSASVDENGLTFWNDLYDDEYGVQVESLNGPMTAKSSDNLDVPKRRENWLRKKYRNLKNLVKDDRSGNSLPLSGLQRKIRDSDVEDEHNSDDQANVPTYTTETYLPEQVDTSAASNTPTTEKPVNFAELTLKMKTVINQAAKAVEETNTAAPSALPELPHPGDSNGTEADVGITLMRHLMRMMSDVMDYQVHARTCLQLPEDLRVFLVQLTAPDPERHLRDVDSGGEGYLNEDDMFTSNSLDLDLSQVREHDSRADCAKTLKTAESLMMEYDMLSDDEKKKLSGVKEYLQKQIEFLTNQCSSFTDFSFDLAPYYQDNWPIHRVKRQINKLDSKKKSQSGKRKKNIGRFLKFWSKTTDTTTAISLFSDEINEENLKDSTKRFYNSKDQLEAAKQAYEMGMQRLKDLNYDVHKQNVGKGDVTNKNDADNQNLDNDEAMNENVQNNQANKNDMRNIVDDGVAKTIVETKITHDDKKLNKLPKPAEMLDPVFQNAILDPAFQNAHKAKFTYFNDAKRLYEKSLKDYEEAKGRFDKATSHYNQRRLEFENSVKQIELAKNIYLTSAESLKKAYDTFLKPKKRNLYDVYFRAVSEAKKNSITTRKSRTLTTDTNLTK